MDAPSAPDPLAALASGEATPRPWHAPGLGEVHSDHDNKVYANPANEDAPEVVADLCSEADAALIVACVNAFAALPAAVIDRIRACGGLAAYVRDLERRIEQYEKTVTPAEYTARENQALRQRVRDLEAARVRAEGVAVSALAKLEADGQRYAQLALEANAETMVAENRVAVLEAALRAADHALEGSQQFMLSIVAALGLPASDVPAATRSLMFEVAHTLEQARAALAPPERSRVAAAPEPPG